MYTTDEIRNFAFKDLYDIKKISNLNVDCYTKGFEKAQSVFTKEPERMIKLMKAQKEAFEKRAEDAETASYYRAGEKDYLACLAVRTRFKNLAKAWEETIKMMQEGFDEYSNDLHKSE